MTQLMIVVGILCIKKMQFISEKMLKSPNINANEGDDEEHLEATHHTILAVNVASNNARIRQSENVLKGHTRTQPCSSFALFDSNCPK